MQNSPYTPGRATAHLPGHEQQLKELERSLMFMTDDPGLEGRIKVYVGPRGVGKTSFLRAAHRTNTRNGYRSRRLDTVIATCYLKGGRTRHMNDLVATLGINNLSRPWVSEMAEELDTMVDEFRPGPR